MKDNSTTKRSILLITYTVLLAAAALNYSAVFGLLGAGIHVLQPFFYGIAFAFVLNILMKKVEGTLPYLYKGISKRFVRALSIMITIVIFIAVIVLVFALLIPQLASSIYTLAQSIPGYAKVASDYIFNMIEGFHIQFTIEDFKNLPWQDWLKNTSEFMQDFFPRFFSSTASITATLANVFMGLIISIYMLMNKEILIEQLKRLIYAFLPRKWADKISEIGKLTCTVMTGFVSGQVMEAFILGSLCFIGMTILRMPYTPLIAVIIGITNLIPFFGPILGTIPCAFIILMADPISALIFVAFVLFLQQVDSNIIYPRVVGDCVNLPAMWIMLSILIGGGLFGLLGMMLGVPVFAVLYAVLGGYVNERYKARMAKKE